MIWREILTALLLGVVGGLIPGPIILLGFSEIVKSPERGLKRAWRYIATAGTTELIVGLFLVTTSSWFDIPPIVFHVLALFGVLLLSYISLELFKIKEIDYEKEQKPFGIGSVIMLMIFNGPLWLFWVSVCLPAAFDLGNKIRFGEYLFIGIFEISIAVTIMLVFSGFNSFRKFLRDQRIVRRIFIILALLMLGIALKMLLGEIRYWM